MEVRIRHADDAVSHHLCDVDPARVEEVRALINEDFGGVRTIFATMQQIDGVRFVHDRDRGRAFVELVYGESG